MSNPIKVGDPLIVVEDDHPRAFDSTVSKVGRKLISVQLGPNWTPTSFRIDPAKPFLEGPAQWRAYTAEQWAFRNRKKAFQKAMREVEREIAGVGMMSEDAFGAVLTRIEDAVAKAKKS